MFSFLGFLGKQNKDRFIFNNYSFVLLIARRFSRKKYYEIFSNFIYYFHVFLGFEAKFYVFAPIISFLCH